MRATATQSREGRNSAAVGFAYLTGCIQNFQNTRHSLVVNDLLVSIFDSRVILAAIKYDIRG